jgi:hypothetical protein|tara:strand:+ start:149 stop:529 length:381 start_codon:yes stop_codon:yes gene_type:complete
MLLMQTIAKLVLINTSDDINQKIPVVNQSLNDGQMIKFERITYDNLHIGAEVRDLTVQPPVMGFVINIEEYGWVDDEGAGEIAHSYIFTIRNCDGQLLEFDLCSLAVSSSLKIVKNERRKNDSNAP